MPFTVTYSIHADSHLSHPQSHSPVSRISKRCIVLQEFLQALGRGQATVAAFNELSNHLLREYSTDDTRRIKEVADKHNAAWISLNNRCIQICLLTLSLCFKADTL